MLRSPIGARDFQGANFDPQGRKISLRFVARRTNPLEIQLRVALQDVLVERER